ncbi:MAG: hypothetical protein RJA09_1433 [Pseudomonadota bacterium]|jgi:hypothetical protein
MTTELLRLFTPWSPGFIFSSGSVSIIRLSFNHV